MKFLFPIALLAIGTLVRTVEGMCPNKCSGKGVCGAWDRCTCYDGYTNADCSGRKCPYGSAWGDVTSVTGQDAHYYAECSGKGECERDSGKCACLDGFEGNACQRITCNADCSGHGTCMLMGDMNTGYSLWDANMVQFCVCDAGWEGSSCESRLCKTGDDPMSVFDITGAQTEVDDQQTIQIALGAATDAESTFVLEYVDWKGESYKTRGLPFPPTMHAIKEALEALPNQVIPSVTVSAVTQNALNQDYTFTVTFSDPETPGPQTALVAHVDGCYVNGCQPVFYGVYSGTRTAVATVTYSKVAGTSERVTCSNRGLCNAETGLCACFEGYYGESCNKQTVIM